MDYREEVIMLTEADIHTSHEMLVMALKYMSQDDIKDMLESNHILLPAL
tara:strand:+ start:1018 stop:1164 length:147 start_codon:yes stop_codon:yes gene_type:complete